MIYSRFNPRHDPPRSWVQGRGAAAITSVSAGVVHGKTLLHTVSLQLCARSFTNDS